VSSALSRVLRPAAVGVGLFATLTSCVADASVSRVTSPITSSSAGRARLTIPGIRISEIHYDNGGTDINEAVEVSGPAGTNLSGWSIVLYNGSGGASYDTKVLSATIPATCGPWGVVVQGYPTNGIQNGAPDGVALIDNEGQVIEYLSYEGEFVATTGAAQGLRSRDIGVQQSGSESITGGVRSLQRSANDTWSGPTAINTFGACNDQPPASPSPVASVTLAPATETMVAGMKERFDATAFDASNARIGSATVFWATSDPAVAIVSDGGVVTAVGAGDVDITATAESGVSATSAIHVDELPPLPVSSVFISEIHYDNDGVDAGEAIEIEGPAGTNLTGWSLVLYNGSNGGAYDTRSLSGIIIPASCGARGVAFVTYASNGIQNGSPDGIALVGPSGVAEFISYEGTMRATDGPALARLSRDIGVLENSSPAGRSLQRDALGWYGPSTSSFGGCNVAPAPFVSITGRLSTDPALPIGYEDQIFPTLNDGRGSTSASTFTWESLTPETGSIDQNGVIHALAAGTMTFKATAANGATGTISLPSRVPVASTTASYLGNTEFGVPTDADASDDYIIRRDQYTSSFNRLRGIPNWVSYNLEVTHFGPEDRCDCFTFDPMLPADFTRYTTADYTGAGVAAGYGIDRGHLARSFDRTSASLDNATTFLFSNIVPQASDNNQGPWAAMEIAVGDLARFSDKELYVIAGASGSKGTVKNEGRITIPAFMWKVVVVMPHDRRLSDVQSWRDLEVIAAIMPNEPGIRDVNWEEYKTTVNAVEKLSGYDLLALLQDDVEAEVESGMTAPLAAVDAAASSGAIAKGNGNSLTVKLDAAATSIERGNTETALNQLDAFMHELRAMRSSGRLDDATAAGLETAAQAMIDSLTRAAQ